MTTTVNTVIGYNSAGQQMSVRHLLASEDGHAVANQYGSSTFARHGFDTEVVGNVIRVTERSARETETRARAKQAESMTCTEHRDGVVHYRPVYGSYECHTYRDRILFTHVVADAQDDYDWNESDRLDEEMYGPNPR